MKHETASHEILLFTGTSFTRQEFCSRDEEKEGGREASSMEQLEKACWAGMLCEILPELTGSTSAKSECFIWHIMPGEHFLCIRMGSCPQMMKHSTSLDPYFFLPSMNRS